MGHGVRLGASATLRKRHIESHTCHAQYKYDDRPEATMRKLTQFGVPVMAAAALIFGATPASAATVTGPLGCTVTAYQPFTSGGTVGATMRVWCPLQTSLTITGEIWEDDQWSDDQVKSLTTGTITVPANGTVDRTIWGPCYNWDYSGYEEMYSRGRINVGGSSSSWSTSSIRWNMVC